MNKKKGKQQRCKGCASTTGILTTERGTFPLLTISIEEQMFSDTTVIKTPNDAGYWDAQGYQPWTARWVLDGFESSCLTMWLWLLLQSYLLDESNSKGSQVSCIHHSQIKSCEYRFTGKAQKIHWYHTAQPLRFLMRTLVLFFTSSWHLLMTQLPQHAAVAVKSM